MKRILSLLLAGMLATTTLASCGKSPSDDNGGNDKGKDDKVLKVAALESAYGADVWKEVAKAFEDTKEGVKVELTIDKKIEEKLRPQMTQGDYPDFMLLSLGREAGLTDTLLKEGKIAPIDDVLDIKIPGEEKTVKEKVRPDFLKAEALKPKKADGDEKMYFAPMFYSPCGLYYNQGLVESKKVEVPKTWDQMFELGKKLNDERAKLKSEGKEKEATSLFAYPVAGYFDAFYFALWSNLGGEEYMNKMVNGDVKAWESKTTDKFFEIMGNLAKYIEPTVIGNANPQNFTKNQQLVLDNKAMFMPNGTWIVGEMKEAPRAEGFKWGQTSLPVLKDGEKSNVLTFMENAWIPKDAKNAKLGKEFMAFMYSDKAAEIFAKHGAAQPIENVTSMFPKTNEDGTPNENITLFSVLDDANAVMANFTAKTTADGRNLKTVTCETFNSVVNGQKTVKEWKAECIDVVKNLK